MTDPEVEAKAKAAVAWVRASLEHEESIGGKLWRTSSCRTTP
jgi:hypothetical protein